MALRLRLEGVHYTYPLSGSREAPALTGADLTVEPGEVICVAGSNGSGKSTLAQVCAGLLLPDSGTVLYGDSAVEGRGKLREFRRRVGLLFQSAEDQLFADTVAGDIAFGPRNHGLRGARLEEAVHRAADLVGLPLGELGDRSPFSLSGGEKRRVALAGVLAMDPEVLVLDEPFIGLDYDGRRVLEDTLARYREERGASILIVTHELSDAWGLAGRFALLSGGKLIKVEDRTDLLSGEVELSSLGMRLPQWGELARELLDSGISVEDPSDPRVIARAMAALREAGRDR